MERKEFKINFKEAESDENFFKFSGMGSPYDGKADLGGDIIERGAFKRTLDQKGTERVLLWSHDTREPIGIVKLQETKAGLEITEGSINLAVKRGAEIASLVKQGAIKGMSIGYRTIKETFEGKYRMLKEVALYELSLVTFPMNEGAGVTGIKNIVGKLKEGLIPKNELLELKEAISELLKTDESKDSKNSDDKPEEKELSQNEMEELKEFFKRKLK